MHRLLTLALVIVFLMVSGCDDPWLTSFPHFPRDTVLVSPRTIMRFPLVNLNDPSGFSLRTHGDAARGAIRPISDGSSTSYLVEIEATQVGEVDVELYYRGDLMDTLRVEVAPFDRLSLRPFQNLTPDFVPAVELPFAVLTDRNVFLALEALDPSGRDFYDARELQGGLIAGDGVEFEVLGRHPRVRIALPGEHVLSMNLPDETIDVSLDAVRPDEVIGLHIEVDTNEDGAAGISVTGVTEAGQHVVGVAPTLTIDGVARESTAGSWLFHTETVPRRGAIEASWNGLTATW